MNVTSSFVQNCEKGKSNARCRRWRLHANAEEKGRLSKRFKGTYTQAQAALREWVSELEAEIPCDETFGAYAERWLRWRADSGDFSDNTISKDRRRIRVLGTVFGGMRLDCMDAISVRDGLSDMRNGRNPSGKVLSGAYMNGLYTCLNTILRQAESDRLIAENPCKGMRPPKIDTKEKEALPPERLSELLDRMDELGDDPRAMAIYLIVLLGLRRSEACALSWANVGPDSITITEAMKEESGRISETKSKAGTRELPMPARLRDKLDAWKVVYDASGFTCGRVCPASNDKPLRIQNLYKWWLRTAQSIGFDGVELHQLRHSNLTIMARRMSVFDLQYWAGWSSIEPAKVYIHRDMGELARAASSLDF